MPFQTIDPSNIAITGGSVTGLTTFSVASGSRQATLDTLTGVAAATNEYVLTKDTATGNAVFKAPTGSSGGAGNAYAWLLN